VITGAYRDVTYDWTANLTRNGNRS